MSAIDSLVTTSLKTLANAVTPLVKFGVNDDSVKVFTQSFEFGFIALRNDLDELAVSYGDIDESSNRLVSEYVLPNTMHKTLELTTTVEQALLLHLYISLTNHSVDDVEHCLGAAYEALMSFEDVERFTPSDYLGFIKQMKMLETK